MNKEVILIGIIALLLGGIIGSYLAKHETFESRYQARNIPTGSHMMGDGSMMRHEDMMDQNGMGQMMNSMLVSNEREFIEGMIPHHQEAVDTAKEVLARGATTPAVKALAENIVTAQEKEISEMKSWYEVWYKTPYQDKGHYMPMMRNLKNLSGKELDKTFLTDMITHHMGAIMMAQSVSPYVEHEEISNLANNIVSTQTKEISDMRIMLKSL